VSRDDFTYLFRRDTVSDNGYLMQVGIKPLQDEHVERPLVSYQFGDNSWYYLNKMVQLCEENGVQLVLIKAPALSPVWWDQWDAQIEEFAEEKGLLYINMLEHIEEIGIDWSKDTYDTGLHLNVYGAEKAASWFGEILSQQCGVPDRRIEQDIRQIWEAKCETYYARKSALEAQRDSMEETK